jgi:hypothetical protein
MTSMVTLAQVKAQSRILQNAEDGLLQGYVDAAELHAQKYLNRNVYADKAAWDADRVKLTDSTAKDAQDAYNAAMAAIGVAPPQAFGFDAFGNPIVPPFQDTFAAQVALEDFLTVQNMLNRILYGMIVTPTFVQAVVLIVASWYVNRETTITELGDAIELPWGAKALLDFDRRQMGA